MYRCSPPKKKKNLFLLGSNFLELPSEAAATCTAGKIVFVANIWLGQLKQGKVCLITVFKAWLFPKDTKCQVFTARRVGRSLNYEAFSSEHNVMVYKVLWRNMLPVQPGKPGWPLSIRVHWVLLGALHNTWDQQFYVPSHLGLSDPLYVPAASKQQTVCLFCSW